MNLPELLSAGSGTGSTLPVKGGPNEENSKGGDSFLNSVRSLSGKDEEKAADIATETEGETAPFNTSVTQNESGDTEAQDDMVTSTASAAPANSVVIQSFFGPGSVDQGTLNPGAQTVTSTKAAAAAQRLIPSPDTSQVSPQVNSGSDQKSGQILTQTPDAEVEPGLPRTNVLTLPGEKPVAAAQPSSTSETAGALKTSDQVLQQQGSLPQGQHNKAGSGQEAVIASAEIKPDQTDKKPAEADVGTLRKNVGVQPEAQIESQAARNRVADESTFEQRLIDKRSDASAVEAKMMDRASQGQQSAMSSSQISARVGLNGTSIVEFGQTASSPQTTGMTGQASGVRELVGDRAAAISMTPVAASEASSRNVISQIATTIRNQPLMQTIELSLDPPELGRVEIQMDVAEVGLKATLSAERPGTGDLIRRQAEILLQQLNDAGFTEVDLDFRDFGSGDKSTGDQTADTDRTQTESFAVKPESAQTDAAPRRQMISNGMDVRL